MRLVLYQAAKGRIDQILVLGMQLSWPTPSNRNLRRAIARLDATVYRIIDERRAYQQDWGDLLSMLLQARDEDDGSGMTDQQVRDEAMTLLLAGHETTANALAWTWYVLMQHPTIYQQVRAEVDQVLAGRTPTVHDLPQLPTLLRMLKESLRMYPPAYIIARSVVKSIELNGHRLTPGTHVGISPYTLHRNPTYFPDPERFDPDRWTPENEAKLPRYAYPPFGAGPHVCIGNHFAMMEAQLILATLVQRVTFELVPGQTIEPEPLHRGTLWVWYPAPAERRDAGGGNGIECCTAASSESPPLNAPRTPGDSPCRN